MQTKEFNFIPNVKKFMTYRALSFLQLHSNLSNSIFLNGSKIEQHVVQMRLK